MIHSCYAAVYSTLLQVRHRTNITYPFDPITQLTNYFPEIKLIKYSSLDPVDIATAKKTHPYGVSLLWELLLGPCRYITTTLINA